MRAIRGGRRSTQRRPGDAIDQACASRLSRGCRPRRDVLVERVIRGVAAASTRRPRCGRGRHNPDALGAISAACWAAEPWGTPSTRVAFPPTAAARGRCSSPSSWPARARLQGSSGSQTVFCERGTHRNTTGTSRTGSGSTAPRTHPLSSLRSPRPRGPPPARPGRASRPIHDGRALAREAQRDAEANAPVPPTIATGCGLRANAARIGWGLPCGLEGSSALVQGGRLGSGRYDAAPGGTEGARVVGPTSTPREHAGVRRGSTANHVAMGRPTTTRRWWPASRRRSTRAGGRSTDLNKPAEGTRAPHVLRAHRRGGSGPTAAATKYRRVARGHPRCSRRLQERGGAARS